MAPASRSASWVSSAGLWLMPSTLGVKTMAVGQTRASIWASWPAPDGMRRTDRPWAVATRSTRSTLAASKATGSNRANVRVSMVTPSASARTSRWADTSASACCSAPSEVLRRSTVNVARAGTTLTRFGCSSMRPTVATCGGPIRSASSRTKTATEPATKAGSWRWAIGVVPAWLDWPVTVTSCHEMPWTPVTAPMSTPSASSTGPCSMCSSTKAAGGRPGTGRAPT